MEQYSGLPRAFGAANAVRGILKRAGAAGVRAAGGARVRQGREVHDAAIGVDAAG